MAANVFNGYYEWSLQNLANATVKVILVAPGFVFNRDTQKFLSDVQASEVTGTGYTAGGQTLSGKTVTQDNTLDQAKITGNALQWTSSTITARGAIYYISTGTATTSYLISHDDFGSDLVSNNGTLTYTPPADGIVIHKMAPAV